jgi:hypothetical protein
MEHMNIDINENNKEKYIFDKDFFIEREFEEVEGGVYQEDGFYVTPEGSFWDIDGDYFNKYGFDRYGGIYDKYKDYIPGEGWLEELQCYKEDLLENDEETIKEILKDRFEESCMNAQEVLNMLEYEESHKDNENTNFNSEVKSKLENFSLMNSNTHSTKKLMSNNKMDMDIDNDYKDSNQNQQENNHLNMNN